MRILQMVLCILACLCVVASVVVGAFLQNLVAVICLLLGAVICGAGLFLVRARANEREERQERGHRRDFMDPPSDDNNADDGGTH